jgi:post-segregation antitoxin (ccd killing protein)
MSAKTQDKTQETVRVDTDQMELLRNVSQLTDVPIAALVRRAIREWLETNYRHVAKGR